MLNCLSIARSGQEAAARQQVITELEDFCPFWS